MSMSNECQKSADPDGQEVSSKAVTEKAQEDRFRLDSFHGLYVRTGGAEEEKWTWICSPINVLGLYRSPEHDRWSYVVEFTDPDKTYHRHLLPTQDLVTDLRGALAPLASQGFVISNVGWANKQFVQYLQTRFPKARYRCVSQVGWHGTT